MGTNANQLPRVVYHEAGHAVAAELLGEHVHSVTVIPNRSHGYAGRCWRSGYGLPTGGDLLRDMTILIAGPIAEGLGAGRMEYQWYWRTGASDYTGFRKNAIALEPDASFRLQGQVEQRTRKLVKEVWSLILEVSGRLFDVGALDGEEVRDILDAVRDDSSFEAVSAFHDAMRPLFQRHGMRIINDPNRGAA